MEDELLLDELPRSIDQIKCYETESLQELKKCKKYTKFTFNGEIHLAKVIRCYDGDTCYCVFKYNGEYRLFTIRMAGYDSWEMKVSLSITDEEKRNELKEKALKGKQRLEELILNKCVYLFCGDFDKYGRILATIKLNLNDKETVNDIMIKEGHGYTYYGGTKHQV